MFGKLFSTDDEELNNQKEDIMLFMSQVPKDKRFELSSVDELPGATGSFGLSPTNPIPANGPIGESVYIFRLRGKSNKPFWYQRLGSFDSNIFSRRIDVYEILSTDGQEWAILYFSMRHVRRSTKAPEGFRLISWKKHKKPFGIAAKLGAFGTGSGPHKDFPYCLPRLVRSNQDLLQAGPPVPRLMAQTIEEVLAEIKVSKRPYEIDQICREFNLINWA